MASEPIERRLAAILCADVVGYSRLMAEDERGTIRSLTTCRARITELVEAHRGRVVDSPGDNVLAEFPSALDAVESGVEIQRELAVRNEALPEERRMQFRIGIHLGDVSVQEGRVYGDGVNIAARLEGLADPGGICVSFAVQEQVRNKVDVAFEDLGEREVKNLPERVRMYRAHWDGLRPATRRLPSERRWWLAAAAVVSVVLFAAWLLWGEEAAPVPAVLPALPDGPSIAVLPFVNRSDDPGQEYFADGLTEDLITDLSKLSGLFVIARNSAFTFKGRHATVDEVGQELGVRYVLEGSVYKAGDRVRVIAALLDARTGRSLWTERYDEKLDEIFTVQDDVTRRIVSALEIRLSDRELGFLSQVPTRNMAAYDRLLRANSYMMRVNREANIRAREHALRAIELDPEFAAAHALLAGTYFFEWGNQWSRDEGALERARELAEKAAALDDSDPSALYALFQAYKQFGKHEEAIATAEKAVFRNPNNAAAQLALGDSLLLMGQPEKALPVLERAARLDPNFPVPDLFMGYALDRLGRQQDAIRRWERVLTRQPDNLAAHVALAAAYVETDQPAKARAAAAEIRRVSPDFTLSATALSTDYLSAQHLDALRQLGLD